MLILCFVKKFFKDLTLSLVKWKIFCVHAADTIVLENKSKICCQLPAPPKANIGQSNFLVT